MSADRVHVLVVGRGFGARVVAPTFAATEGCRVVDVVSARDEASVLAAVARPDVDLVSVHSPPFLHARDVRAALEAGKAVLCDKPFMVGAEVISRGSDVRLVNFEFRYEPARIVVRDAIARGTIGQVERVRWVHRSAGTRVPMRRYGWLFDASRGGGWVGAWGSHAVDSLRWLFGEVEAVVAATRSIAVPRRVDEVGVEHECTAEDGLVASLRLTGGVAVSIDSTYAAPRTSPPRLEVLGDAGALEVHADSRVTLRRPSGAVEVLFSTDRAAEHHTVAMRAWAEVVRDSVRAGAPQPGAATFADGLACDAVLDRLRAAPLTVHRS